MISQEVSLKATVHGNEFGLKELVRVEFSMNKENEDFNPPSFEEFEKITGPDQTINQQYINGISTYTKTISYELVPKHLGTVFICEAQASINGKIYSTQPIELTIIKKNTPLLSKDTDVIIDYKDKIHLLTKMVPTSKLSDTIAVSYKLLISDDIAIKDWGDQMPIFKHFKILNYETFELEVKQEQYLNEEYRSVIVKKFNIIPKKKGTFKLERYFMTLNLKSPTSKKDFFGTNIRTESKIKVYGEEPEIRIY